MEPRRRVTTLDARQPATRRTPLRCAPAGADPGLDARPGRAGRARRRAPGAPAPAVVFCADGPAGYVAARGAAIGARPPADPRSSCPSRIGRSMTRHVNTWFARHRTPTLDDLASSARRSATSPSCPRSSSLAAIVAALAPALPDRRRSSPGAVLSSSPPTASTSLVVHRDRPLCRGSTTSGRTRASLGPRGGVGRRLRRARAADHVGDPQRWRRRLRLALAVLLPRHRRRSRACTAACTTRPTSPPACSWASARCSSRCSRARGDAAVGVARHAPTERRMTRVAVIAHTGKTLGGGLPSCGACSSGGRRRPALVRGAEEPRGARSRSAGVEDGADLVFVWGGDGMVQRCIDVARGHRRRRSRSSRPAPRTCWRRTSGSRRTSSRRSRSVCTATRRTLDVGRINGEHFAVMAGAGFDARMIGDADGALKDRFGRARLRLDRREAPARRSRSRRRSRSTARAGSTARRAASCSATSASCSAASRRSRTHGPTTACSSSASSPPTARAVGADDRARGRRQRRQVPAGAHDEGALRAHQPRQEGPLRARRRRTQARQEAARRCRAPGRRGVRARGRAGVGRRFAVSAR